MIGKPENFNLVYCKAVTLAEQFTLMHFGAFKAISKRECLGQSWKKKDGSAPGILNMIGLFNQTAKWVQILILTQPNLSKRTKVMKLCISVATYMKLCVHSVYVLLCCDSFAILSHCLCVGGH